MDSKLNLIFDNFKLEDLKILPTHSDSKDNSTHSDSKDNSTHSDSKDNSTHLDSKDNIKKPILIIRSKIEINNEWSILDICVKKPPKWWFEFFKSSLSELEIINSIISKYESNNCISYPYRKNIFKSFDYIKPTDIKCVICDLEPYSNINLDGIPLATGLALSVNKNVYKIPNSILNIYKELKYEYPEFNIPNHGNLENWCKEGVFLLNLSLTVKPNESHSHKELWTGFIIKVIEYLNSIDNTIPYILLNKDCLKIVNYISGKSPIFKINNPSFNNSDLFKSNIFKKINTHLTKSQKIPINWNVL